MIWIYHGLRRGRRRRTAWPRAARRSCASPRSITGCHYSAIFSDATCVMAEYVWWRCSCSSSVFIRRLFDDPQHSGFCRGWRVRVRGPQQWHHNINHLVPRGGQRSVAIIAIASEVLLSVIIWRLGGLKDLMIGLDFHLKWIKQEQDLLWVKCLCLVDLKCVKRSAENLSCWVSTCSTKLPPLEKWSKY